MMRFIRCPTCKHLVPESMYRIGVCWYCNPDGWVKNVRRLGTQRMSPSKKEVDRHGRGKENRHRNCNSPEESYLRLGTTKRLRW